MRVRARHVDWKSIPPLVARHSSESQTFLTVGREYEVHAIAVFDGLPSLQIVNDIDYPAWQSTWFFDAVDHALPRDWRGNFFRDEPGLLLGPDFVTRDEASYGAMVELEPEPVGEFWERVEAREANRSVSIDLSGDEARVLSDWLSRLHERTGETFEHEAEQSLLRALHNKLAAAVTSPLEESYVPALSAARKRVRDRLRT